MATEAIWNDAQREYDRKSAAIDKAFEEADRLMKETNGHYFVTMLKTRCQYCGRSPKVKTKCGSWFQTYLLHLRSLLMDTDFDR